MNLDLNDMSLGHRVVVTAIIVIVLLLLLAMFGYLTGRWDEAGAETAHTPRYCVTDEEARERIRGFMFSALDQALQDNFEHLFAVWMKDARGQPERARVGVGQAIEAHKQARILATAWVPPICEQK